MGGGGGGVVVVVVVLLLLLTALPLPQLWAATVAYAEGSAGPEAARALHADALEALGGCLPAAAAAYKSARDFESRQAGEGQAARVDALWRQQLFAPVHKDPCCELLK